MNPLYALPPSSVIREATITYKLTLFPPHLRNTKNNYMALIPETSPHYTYSLKTVLACPARYPHTVELDTPSNHAEDYQLRISYRKYRTTRQLDPSTKPLNLAFCHGNGMNKGLWHYHIDKLYQQFPQLNVVIAIDQVNHGDLVPHNRGKIGSVYNWNDGGKDVAKILTVDEQDVFLQPNAVNVLIGHSLGGFQLLMATSREPQLFDLTIIINGVTELGQRYKDLMKRLVKLWLDAQRVVLEFDTKGKDWYAEVMKFMEKQLFFKRFQPTVLHNMVYDEYLGIYDQNQSYDRVELKTSARAQYTVYRDGPDLIWESLPKYELITLKVYVVFCDKDLLTPEGREDLIRRLPNAEHVLIKDRYHLYNAEQPDECLATITPWIEETYANAKPKSIDPSNCGPGVSERLYQKYLSEFISKL